MRVAELVGAPQWLKDAVVRNEDVELCGGNVIWHSGEWHGGVWRNGVWRNGVWHNGEWRNGEWRGGIWYSGEWYGGEWHGGVWRNGVWHNGEWRNGIWHSGEWHGGVWRSGEWYGGEWYGGEWHGGVWRNGVWHNGEWRNGNWYGGAWHNGRWRNGIWCSGEWRNGEWHDGEWHGGVWRGGVWRGLENRLFYMATMCGIVFDGNGEAVAYRTTNFNGYGRYTRSFIQTEGEYYEEDAALSGAGTCMKGIHVASAATAWTYFGVDQSCQFWRVRFKREDLLDCDGQKARIRGGFFEKINRPF